MYSTLTGFLSSTQVLTYVTTTPSSDILYHNWEYQNSLGSVLSSGADEAPAGTVGFGKVNRNKQQT